MVTVRDILARKTSQVITTEASASVLEATQLMNAHKIGALVVTEGERIAGMFTERDVLSRVVVAEKSPSSVLVSEVMTKDVICCEPGTPLDDASRILKDHRIRHLPVCGEDGKLAGVLSIGDINAYHASDREAQIHFMSEYIHGRI
jgi:CBS domain-containing protein